LGKVGLVKAGIGNGAFTGAIFAGSREAPTSSIVGTWVFTWAFNDRVIHKIKAISNGFICGI
jgi:hypothetical protein